MRGSRRGVDQAISDETVGLGPEPTEGAARGHWRQAQRTLEQSNIAVALLSSAINSWAAISSSRRWQELKIEVFRDRVSGPQAYNRLAVVAEARRPPDDVHPCLPAAWAAIVSEPGAQNSQFAGRMS